MEKLVPDPFFKNQNWAFIRINSQQFYTVCFYYIVYWQNILKLRCKPLAFTSYKAVLKNKKRSENSPHLPYFLHDFWRKIFLTSHSIKWPKFIVWLTLFYEMFAICVLYFLFPRLWRRKMKQKTYFVVFKVARVVNLKLVFTD